jgi:hypothetical protein
MCVYHVFIGYYNKNIETKENILNVEQLENAHIFKTKKSVYKKKKKLEKEYPHGLFLVACQEMPKDH